MSNIERRFKVTYVASNGFRPDEERDQIIEAIDEDETLWLIRSQFRREIGIISIEEVDDEL